jgi:hypothetical protein
MPGHISLFNQDKNHNCIFYNRPIRKSTASDHFITERNVCHYHYLFPLTTFTKLSCIVIYNILVYLKPDKISTLLYYFGPCIPAPTAVAELKP